MAEGGQEQSASRLLAWSHSQVSLRILSLIGNPLDCILLQTR